MLPEFASKTFPDCAGLSDDRNGDFIKTRSCVRARQKRKRVPFLPDFLIGVIYSIPIPLNICSGGITEQLNNDLIFCRIFIVYDY